MWIAASGIALLAGLGVLRWRFPPKGATTYGSARWCDVFTLFKKGYFKQRGIRVGDFVGKTSVYYDSVHAVTIGDNGSGKGAAAIVPNLLGLDQVFIVDPGGENTAITAKRWRQDGRKLFCFNPFGMFTEAPWSLPQHGFNPLDYLNTTKASVQADAKVLAEMLIQRTGSESGTELYFMDQAEDFLEAVLLFLKVTRPRAEQHLGTLYNVLNGTSEDWGKLIVLMQSCNAVGGTIAKRALAIDRIMQQSEKEFSAIMSTLQKNISWLADSTIRAHMERSDFDFGWLKGFGDEPGVMISIVLPLNYVSSHAAMLRLATACAIIQFQTQPLAKGKIVFVLDEAFALGKLKSFETWLATLRKYNIVIWSIWQNIGQLRQLYGQNWETILSNSGLVQFMSFGDLGTAEYAEKMLGRCTVFTTGSNGRGQASTSETARSLRFATELMRPTDENEQVDFIDKLPPTKLKKTPYYERQEFVGLYHRNPYRSEEPGDVSAAVKLSSLLGKTYMALVWFFAPHPAAAWVILTGAVLALNALFGGS